MIRNRPYFPIKKKPDPLLKIGINKEVLEYTDKNIDPNLNFLDRYFNDEERKKYDKLKRQKEEFKYLSKKFEENNNKNPNIEKKKIYVDHISGKIGQENREIEYNKYQQNDSSLTTDQIRFQNINNNNRNINYNGYNIINNNILGINKIILKYRFL
jgi:hypothetical protein